MADVFDFYVKDNRTIQFNLTEPIMLEDSHVSDWVFHIPMVLNNIDMSGWAWWLVYINAKGQKYSELLELSEDPESPLEKCIATYSVDYGMSIRAGVVRFSLEAINADTQGAILNEWHTQTYQAKVQDTLQGNQVEFAETESDIISALIVEVQNKVAQLVGGATPEPVSLIADMTDTSKVYLYVGSETGESTNYWYYHNGTRFVPGGLYASGITVDTVPTQGSTNAVQSGGVWDALRDTDTTLTKSGQAADAKKTGDKITSLKEDLIESGLLRISGDVPLTVGGYINTSGNVVSNSDFSYTDFIDATSIKSVYSCMGYNIAVLACYDENKQFVGYMPTTAGEYVSQWWELDKPNGTKYIRFSNRKNLSNDAVKIKSIINIDGIVETVDALDEKEKYISDDIIPNTITLTNEYPGVVNRAGQIIDVQHHSEPILLKKGQTINLTCMSYSVIAPIARFVEGYNRYVVLVLGNEDLGVHTYSYTAFEDMYVVLSWYDAYTHDANISEIYSFVDLDESITQQGEVDYSACVSRILCIGDSLTAGALFLNTATNYVGDNAKSYPYFLSKEMNIQCINKGSDGATPEIWFDRLYTETVFNDYDCLLLWLGTNHGLSDTIETDVDAFNDYHDYTGNTGKYCRIIEEFKEKTNDAPVFLIKVFDGGYDTKTGITIEITNSVIDKIAQKYNVPTIETAEFLYQTPPEGYSDLAVKIHGVNELHFNTYGNMYIAHHFHEAMKAYWKNNTDKMDRPYRLMGDGLPWWMEH